MSRRAGPPKERKHVHLTEGAWDKLVELYGPKGITPSSVIAQLVDFHLRRIEEKANLKMAQLTRSEDDLEIRPE